MGLDNWKEIVHCHGVTYICCGCEDELQFSNHTTPEMIAEAKAAHRCRSQLVQYWSYSESLTGKTFKQFYSLRDC